MTYKGLMELQPYGNASRNFSINGQGSGGYIVWDGATVQSNCTAINGIPYTYNNALFLLGAATMYNYVSAFVHIP
jgi:mannan endo-1,6-alpha-mannosidase